MSWSVSAIGKPAAVGKSLFSQFGSSKCEEPEESIRAKVAEALALVAAAQDPASVIRVSAQGSQTRRYDPKAQAYTDSYSNSVAMTVEVLHGFVE